MLIFHFYAHTSLVRTLTTTRNGQHSLTEEAHAQRSKHHEDTTYGDLGHSKNREDAKFSFELVEKLQNSSANPLVTVDEKEDATKAIKEDEQSDLEFVSDFYSIPSFQTAKESICCESDNVIVGDIVSSNKNDEKLVITETKKQDDNKKHFAYRAKKKFAKIKRMVHKAYKKACKKGDDAFRYVFPNVSSNKRSGTEQDVCQSETQKLHKIETTDADTQKGENVTVELQNPDTSQDSLMIFEWDTLPDAETAKTSAVNTKSIDCEFEISDNTKRFVEVYYLLRDYLVSNNYELRDDERIMEMLQTTLKLDERKVSYNILEHKSNDYVYVAHTGEKTADSLVMVDENVILPLKQTEERDSIATTLSKCVSSELIYDEKTGKKKLKVKILITDHAHEAFETIMSKMEPYYDLIRKGLENALVSRSVELYYIVSGINAFFNSSVFQFLAHIATRRE